VKTLNLSGKKFGQLTAIHRDGHSGKKVVWMCECECGNFTRSYVSDLTAGKSTSCGHDRIAKSIAARQTHGMTNSPTYITWLNMIQRTTNSNHPRFADYGGRGITVCDEWRSFETFYRDMGDRPAGRSLDRIDNDASYAPGNCRWANDTEQANNTRGQPLRQRDPVTGRWMKS
jgi:hypothetical protein